MNSTGAPDGLHGSVRRPTAAARGGFTLLAACLAACLVVTPVPAEESPVSRPPQLERDVEFWIRVYTQIDTDAGFLHDQYNLAVVYDTWGAEGTPSRLHAATEDIRFQLGQADRFRAGLIRSGAWETHIAQVLANLGLPAELAVLPHVESSFNPAAYSKVGAAGLWQFMRSTGRRYMRIDSAVADRLDPFRSTEAAAQLLAYNYRVLGTWPLALTAYNHGTAGVRRAKETLGTDDIVRIVRSYNSRTFGFASRNFYVSFLAALEVDRNPEKYFGSLQRQSAVKFQEVQLPAYVSMPTLERALRIEPEKLRALNPALTHAVWDGRQRVPKAYRLRLPLDGTSWTRELLAQRLSPGEMFAGQSAPPRYRVQAGDTLVRVAARYGVSADTLARMNHLRVSARLRVGRTIDVPEAAAVTVASTAAPAPAAPAAPAPTAPAAPAPAPTAAARAPAPTPYAPAVVAAAAPHAPVFTISVGPASAGGAVSAEVAQRESAEDAAVAAAARTRTASVGAQPVSAAQAEAIGPALGPALDAEQNADPIDYSVAHDDSIRVTGDETLGHYADWLGVSTAHVREINHLRFGRRVLIGQHIRLDFRKVSHEAFEARRREYHRELQASFFAAHRIVGTQLYVARPGDSLWTLTQRATQMPLWLVQQYNPDVDLADLRAGTQIVMPRVEEVGSGG
ncbi:MAG: LysM peptidoglycan-binding domain-containing protein [Gammaproteobacteria bacterium]|nr:MAG: LysM peptidoglycan-binding domain-containing protein [Gammaproteobacteria bacterium]